MARTSTHRAPKYILTHPGMTRTLCCPKCPRKSSLSGISRHRQSCKEYQLYLADRQALRHRVTDVLSKSSLRKVESLKAQRAEQEAESERMQMDDTVSSSYIICLWNFLTVCRYPSLSLRLQAKTWKISLGQGSITVHQPLLQGQVHFIRPHCPYCHLLHYPSQGVRNESGECLLDSMTCCQNHPLLH